MGSMFALLERGGSSVSVSVFASTHDRRLPTTVSTETLVLEPDVNWAIHDVIDAPEREPPKKLAWLTQIRHDLPRLDAPGVESEVCATSVVASDVASRDALLGQLRKVAYELERPLVPFNAPADPGTGTLRNGAGVVR